MKNNIELYPIPALKDNYIWMLGNVLSKHAWVVDPGDAKPVIAALKKHGFTLKGILLTHHHADHSGGIQDLLFYAENIPVYGSHRSPISNITHPLKNGDKINCLSIEFQIIEIPGHTLDHLAYYGDHILFSGDTLFSVGCGRIFEGTPVQLYDSLITLSKLPDDTKIYCGHEYTLANLHFAQHVDPTNDFIKNKITKLQGESCTLPALMYEEKKTNPFLRCDERTIINSVEVHVAKKLKTPVDVFYHLREWKNSI